MSVIHRVVTVNPADLSQSDRDGLTDRLFAVHCEIFDGVERESFRQYVVESSAERTVLGLFHDAAGQLVGYAAVHRFAETWRGAPLHVWRAETGLLNRARGGGHAARFIANQLLRGVFRNPFVRSAYLGAFVHPAPYTAFLSRCPDLYPRPELQHDAEKDALMNTLAQRFGMPEVEGARPGVRQVGWVSRTDAARDRWWRNRNDASSRYYIERNPTYGEGHGLLVLAIAEPAVVARGLMGLAKRRLERWWERRERRLIGPRLELGLEPPPRF